MHVPLTQVCVIVHVNGDHLYWILGSSDACADMFMAMDGQKDLIRRWNV
jgi:hypothetical protein